MPRRAKDIEAGLSRKGFQRRESKDAYFHLWIDGKKTAIYTKMSQGETEIHDVLVSAMARQLKLTTRQFGDLIECPLKLDEYTRILRDGGHIE